MRKALVALTLVLTACGQPGAPQATTTTTAPPAAATGAGLDHDALVGTWSFDRSCASGDGMTLRADSGASYDEWGEGHWVVDLPARIILTLAKTEPGVGPTGQHVMVTIDVTGAVGDDLQGSRSFDDGTPADTINARRCPESP